MLLHRNRLQFTDYRVRKAMKKKSFMLIELLLVVFFVVLISFFILRGYSNFVKVAQKEMFILKTLLLTEEGALDLLIKEKNFDSVEGLPEEYELSDENFILQYEAVEQVLGEIWRYTVNTENKEKREKKLDMVLFLSYEEDL